MNSTISFPFMNNGVWSRMFFLLFSPIQTKICLLRRKITSVFQRIAFYLENNSLKCTSPYEASYIPQSKEITTADARLKEEAAFLTRGKFWNIPHEKDSSPAVQEELAANPASGMQDYDELESSVPSSNEETMVGSSYGIVELEDTAALSEAVGFPVEDLTSLPFEVRQVTYCSYFNDFAEIDYTGDGQSLSYRKARGTEDISGDYNEYQNEKHLTITGLDVLLKGNSEKYTLVSWTDGTYAYALSFEQEVTEEEITTIISSMSVMN